MKVIKSVTETYVISDIKRVDPITVYVQNQSEGKGKITIECYGSSWSSYWGGMGKQNLQSFFSSCDNHYLLKNLVSKTTCIDFDSIEKTAKEKGISLCIENEVQFAFYSSELEECFGEDWFMNLPHCSTPEYIRVGRIIDAIRISFKEEGNHPC